MRSCAPVLIYLRCGADGKCTDERVAVGQPCGGLNGETVSCVTGARCNEVVCIALKKEGETCVSDRDCGGDKILTCDVTSKTCKTCPP
jgi:hypothetical protein